MSQPISIPILSKFELNVYSLKQMHIIKYCHHHNYHTVYIHWFQVSLIKHNVTNISKHYEKNTQQKIKYDIYIYISKWNIEFWEQCQTIKDELWPKVILTEIVPYFRFHFTQFDSFFFSFQDGLFSILFYVLLALLLENIHIPADSIYNC